MASDVRARINRITAILPLVISALAFGIVIANILAGVPPKPDEDLSAHLWQLLMAGQLPLILVFLVSADWRRWSTALILGAQLAAIAAACVPVWLAGY